MELKDTFFQVADMNLKNGSYLIILFGCSQIIYMHKISANCYSKYNINTFRSIFYATSYLINVISEKNKNVVVSCMCLSYTNEILPEPGGEYFWVLWSTRSMMEKTRVPHKFPLIIIIPKNSLVLVSLLLKVYLC